MTDDITPITIRLISGAVGKALLGNDAISCDVNVNVRDGSKNFRFVGLFIDGNNNGAALDADSAEYIGEQLIDAARRLRAL